MKWHKKGHSKWLCHGSDYYDDLEYTIMHGRISKCVSKK